MNNFPSKSQVLRPSIALSVTLVSHKKPKVLGKKKKRKEHINTADSDIMTILEK